MFSSDMVPKIESYILETRLTVCVGQHIVPLCDFRVLQHLQLDLCKSNFAIVNTTAFNREVSFSQFLWELRRVLEEPQCAHDICHWAGHDAHLTLRCLLLLVSWSVIYTGGIGTGMPTKIENVGGN